ncbi:CRE-NPH-4 protein [Caenorhabditis remanei]|uniref:CRE-NPH-4 protein n=1 Tax=Caenorhabditis remanei TaxID=31234 RepID=E3LPT1_CAERE|nr:CRE-NPH-4 protein [Caenorhabditis remanei]
MSVNDWYSLFLANRPVEMKRNASRGKKISCYSMYISKLKSPQVTENLRYQISSFLYDQKTSQMFGRQCRTEWRTADNNGTCVFNEALYFYSEVNDRDLLLIIEFVEQAVDDITPATSLGWFTTNVEKRRAVEISENRSFEIFGGTPKLLIFDKEVILKSVGNVECSYNTYNMPPFFFQTIPEFCIVCEDDIIPGILNDDTDGEYFDFDQVYISLQNIDCWLSSPKEMATIPAAIDAIAIQFKNNVPELERQITNDIEREWALKEGGLNKPKAVIMDRKLRIGVHNGYTYVTEPFTVDLEIINANEGGTLRSRKKPIDFGKSSNWGEQLIFQAAGNPRLALRNLYADSRMAIIFLLEYTFHREDNQSLNQTILIGWAAWTPFSDNIFAGKEVETRVSFVGGPRPNPEGVLCYKNVLNQPDSVKPLNEKLEIFVDFKFYENGKSVHNTPITRRSEKVQTARSSENVNSGRSRGKNVTIETPRSPENSSRFPALVDTGRSISSVDELKSINEELDRFIEEPTEQPIQEIVVPKKAVEEPLPFTSVYKIPFEEMKPANFPRSVYSMFARLDFIQLRDRNGEAPSTEDVTLRTIVDMKRESLDRLDTAHIYFQFIAFKQLVILSSSTKTHLNSRLASPDTVITKKVFITLNFYRFPEITTESMLLTQMERGEPHLLRRVDSNGAADETAPPGFIAKYIIEGEESKLDFLDFIATGHACVDVWDSDSLIHLGSTIVPLKSLYRKGREAVQSFIQCPVLRKLEHFCI